MQDRLYLLGPGAFFLAPGVFFLRQGYQCGTIKTTEMEPTVETGLYHTVCDVRFPNVRMVPRRT